jgi:hypothetical protein
MFFIVSYLVLAIFRGKMHVHVGYNMKTLLHLREQMTTLGMICMMVLCTAKIMNGFVNKI